MKLKAPVLSKSTLDAQATFLRMELISWISERERERQVNRQIWTLLQEKPIIKQFVSWGSILLHEHHLAHEVDHSRKIVLQWKDHWAISFAVFQGKGGCVIYA